MFSPMGTLSRLNWACAGSAPSLAIKICGQWSSTLDTVFVKTGAVNEWRSVSTRISNYQPESRIGSDSGRSAKRKDAPSLSYRRKYKNPKSISILPASISKSDRKESSGGGSSSSEGRSPDSSSEIASRTESRTALEVVRAIRREKGTDETKLAVNEEVVIEEIFEPRGTKEGQTTRPVRTRKNAEQRHDVDSRGFKTYTHVVPDWDKMIGDDVVGLLKRSIIYNEHDIVAINKPYGLPVHGGPSVHHNVARYLPKLAEVLNPAKKQTLHLVHRIDKETTGVLLLARTAERAAQIHDMFLKRLVRKTYWVLTRGIPDPLKGIVDIPIGESDASGTHRKVLRPGRTEVTSLERKAGSQKGKEAITNYTVLGATKDCALVEISPETGVKHQVRVHMAFGINTPILGDHKYSHYTKLAPQKLPPSFLKAFDIRQQKVRTIPMHLHAINVVLPEFIGGQNLHISAPLPEYFTHSMRKLNVRKSKFD